MRGLDRADAVVEQVRCMDVDLRGLQKSLAIAERPEGAGERGCNLQFALIVDEAPSVYIDTLQNRQHTTRVIEGRARHGQRIEQGVAGMVVQ